MKLTTEIWMAMRNVGDAESSAKVTAIRAPLIEQLKTLSRAMQQLTMATRIVVQFGRTESEALRGLTDRSPSVSGASELDAFIDGLADSETAS